MSGLGFIRLDSLDEAGLPSLMSELPALFPGCTVMGPLCAGLLWEIRELRRRGRGIKI